MKCLQLLLPMALLGAIPTAHGAIVYSGLQNIAIPYTFSGVYVNIQTLGTSFNQPADFDTSPWLNLDFGGVDISNGVLITPIVIGVGLDQVSNLSGGSTVGPAGIFASGPNASTTHLGPAVDQFQSNTPGYIGFSFNASPAGPTNYGWMRISINDSGTGNGTVHDWAYEDVASTSLPAGVPEPTGLALRLWGISSVLLRRARAS